MRRRRRVVVCGTYTKSQVVHSLEVQVRNGDEHSNIRRDHRRPRTVLVKNRRKEAWPEEQIEGVSAADVGARHPASLPPPCASLTYRTKAAMAAASTPAATAAPEAASISAVMHTVPPSGAAWGQWVTAFESLVPATVAW